MSLRSRRYRLHFGSPVQVEYLEVRTLLSYSTIIDNGSSANRVDIVFMGDGYTTTDLGSGGAYQTHISSMLNHLFQDQEDPFPRYEKFFNVHRIDVVSNQTGADVPPENVFRDTALDASYFFDGVTDRLLYINQAKADQIQNTSLAGAPFTAEMQLVTVNSERYGGGGGAYAVYAGANVSASEVALHELGHSFSGLADEYGGFTDLYTGGEPSEINVSKNASGIKWSQWLGYDQPGIGIIGSYEGARYYDRGLYRPSMNSKMRSLGTPFDAVSREKIILDIYSKVDPLDTWRSNTGLITGSNQTLWVDTVDPNVIRVEWQVDGVPVAGASGETFNPQAFGVSQGTHTITARAFDPTDWVRINRGQLEQTISWTVEINAGPTISPIANQTIREDSSTAVISFTVGDPTIPAGSLLVTATSSNSVLVPNARIVIAGTGANRTVKVTPAENQWGTATISIQVSNGSASATKTFVVTVTAVNDLPAVAGFDTVVSYTENSAPVLLDSNATVTDVDDSFSAGAKLTLSLTAGTESTDRLGIRSAGTLPGQISVSGNTVSYGGTLIGTFAGTTTLVVTLNNNSTVAAVQELLRNTTFFSLSENPSILDRTVRVTLTDGAGGTSNSPVKAIKVIRLNDAPIITGVSGSVTYTENATPALIAGTAVVSDADLTMFAGAKLTVGVTGNSQSTDRIGIRSVGTLPGQISVTGNSVSYGGTVLGTFTGTTTLNVTFNGSVTVAAVQALLRNVTFSSLSENPSILDRTIRVTLTDGAGGTSNSPEKTVRVTAKNDAPGLGGISGTLTYTENAVPALIGATATVSDVDLTVSTGAKLTVGITGNAQSTDRIGIRSVGTLAGQISVVGNSVSFGGTVIGTFTGTTTLSVTFNSSVTIAAVQAVLRHVTFSSLSENPSTLARTVQFTLTDGAGGTSNSPVRTVNVIRRNDAPVIAGFDTPVTYIRNTAPVLLDSNATVTDPDETVSAGARLTVTIVANLQSTDRIGIRSTGALPGQISVSGSVVRYGGVAIGTLTGTTSLAVTLNSSATVAGVQALLRSITFSTVSATSSGLSRTVRVQLTDGAGGTSNAPTKVVTIIGGAVPASAPPVKRHSIF